MRTDVQHVFQVSLPGLIPEHLDTDDLADPVRSGLEVVQKDVVCHFLTVKIVNFFRIIVTGPLQDTGFKVSQGQASVFDEICSFHNLGHLGRGLRKGFLRFPQEQESCGLQPCITMLRKPGCKIDEPSPHLFVIILRLKAADGIQKGESRIIVQRFRPDIIAKQCFYKAGLGLSPAVPQNIVDHDMQRETDL